MGFSCHGGDASRADLVNAQVPDAICSMLCAWLTIMLARLVHGDPALTAATPSVLYSRACGYQTPGVACFRVWLAIMLARLLHGDPALTAGRFQC